MVQRPFERCEEVVRVFEAHGETNQPVDPFRRSVSSGVKYSDTVRWWLTLVVRPSNDNAYRTTQVASTSLR